MRPDVWDDPTPEELNEDEMVKVLCDHGRVTCDECEARTAEENER